MKLTKTQIPLGSSILLLIAASLLMVACSGQQTVLNTTEVPTLTAESTEAPSPTAEPTEAPTPTAVPTEVPTKEPPSTPEPGAEPFDLPEYDFEYDADKFEVMTIYFPENKKGKTELNAYTYDINPFAARFIVPKGWTYRSYTDEHEIFMDGWNICVKDDGGTTALYTTLWIFNEKNECVGAIGYDVSGGQCEPIDEENSRNPKAIYCMLKGTGYAFRYDLQYEVVPNNWDNETALTQTYYSVPYLSAYDIIIDKPYSNPGILSCDFDAMVYVAMELDGETISDELVLQIAKSLQLISK